MSNSKVVLVCDECLSRNYTFNKNKVIGVKVELKKHCKQCNKHTTHIETR